MLDENMLAKTICRADLRVKVEGFLASGDASKAMEPGLRIKMEKDIAEQWQRYLPHARAVIKAIGQ
jgi:hypothetical protein